ncbi:hypothetical protein [Streptomyces sp. NPDC054975]
MGGPFMLLIPVAFCGALLLQARTILELAGLDGRDTTAPERAAELLVLQGVYADTETAMARLRARPEPTDGPLPRPGRIAVLWDLVLRMARLLGILTPDDGGSGPSRVARLGRWALLIVVILTGLVAPLVWLPYLALSYHRSTTVLTDRATLFYFGVRDRRAPRAGRLQPDMVVAGLRALVSLLIPAVGVALIVLTDTRIAGAHWPLLALLLVTTPLIVGSWWLWRRRPKRRSRR